MIFFIHQIGYLRKNATSTYKLPFANEIVLPNFMRCIRKRVFVVFLMISSRKYFLAGPLTCPVISTRRRNSSWWCTLCLMTCFWGSKTTSDSSKLISNCLKTTLCSVLPNVLNTWEIAANAYNEMIFSE